MVEVSKAGVVLAVVTGVEEVKVTPGVMVVAVLAVVGVLGAAVVVLAAVPGVTEDVDDVH